MKNIYRYAGKLIETERDLPSLPLADGDPDILLTVIDAAGPISGDEGGVDVRRVGAVVTGRSAGEVGFVFDSTRLPEVTIEVEPHVPAHRVDQLVLDWVLPYVRAAQGALVMHATGTVIDGRVFAFCGQSGRGKSTTAAALAVRGHELVADDTLVVDDASIPPLVLPSHPSSRLRADSLQRLTDRNASDPSRKTVLDEGDFRFRSQATELGGVFILKPGAAPRIEPLGAHGLSELIEQTYIIGDIGATLDRLIALAGSVPIQSLYLPHDFEQLGDTLDLIVERAHEV